MRPTPPQPASLRPFLRVLLTLTLLFAVAEVLGGLLLDVWELVAEGLLLLLFAGATVLAQAIERRGQSAAAAQLVAYGLLAVGVSSAPIVPHGLAPLAFVPIISVATALPYLQGRAIRRLFVTAFVAQGLLTLLSIVTPPRHTPPLFTPVLLGSALLAATLLALMMLYRFSQRLQHTLEASLAANARLRASEERFRSLTVATSQLVWTTNPQGLVVEDSPSWRAFTGQTYEEAKGMGWLEAIHPEDRPRAMRVWREAMAARTAYEVEYRVRRPDGGYTPTVSRGAPVLNEDGRLREWVGANTDITERARAEEELRRAVRARDDFLGQAGHELRTPLTSLKLQIQGLRNTLKAQAEKAQAEKAQAEAPPLAKLSSRLALVERQVKRLETLTATLLDISRLSTGKMVLELAEVELGQLTRDAVASTLEQFPTSAGLVTVRAQSVTGHWDTFRLEQVILNLLSNALKYGAGRPVEVSVHPEEEQAVLTVRDQGLGISPEDQARIFERFERAASGRHYPGVGLGLWIVREVVQALGGTVTLDSRAGEGSTFTVRLPRRGPPD